MTRRNSPPVLGAALDVEHLELHRRWVLEHQRDLEIQDFIDIETLLGDWRPIADAARKLLDGHRGRVGIHGPFYGWSIDTQDPDVREIVKRRLDAGLEALRAINGEKGGGHMVVHSPSTLWDYNHYDLNSGMRQKQIERVRLCLNDAVRKAEAMGAVIVIENCDDTDPAFRVDLARSFESPAVRVSIDTGHALLAHGTYGAPPVDAFVNVAGEMLAHVHLQDADGHGDRHWVMGEGSVPWHAVFRALAKLPEMPRLMIELNDLSRIPEAAAWLERQGLAV
ncbi:MAG: sugar phosphate isomerase/epimerase family protein [Hyphomicrobiaceae bacterium]